MSLCSLIVSRDLQESSVLECILSALHIDVCVERDPARAWEVLCKSKVDALIVDCDTEGTDSFLLRLRDYHRAAPVLIASGTPNGVPLAETGANFVLEKPVSVAQAVPTFSAARNLILNERLRYYREPLDMPARITRGKRGRLGARIQNISQGGTKLTSEQALTSGETVRLSFSLPGTRASFRAEGKVAWADSRGNAGISFAGMQQATQRKLQFWIEQRYFRARELRP